MNADLFMKYPSLTNHYNVGKDRTLSGIMLDKTKMFYATEKVDGTNVSLNIDLKTGEFLVGSRNNPLDFSDGMDGMFNGLDSFLNQKLVDEVLVRFEKVFNMAEDDVWRDGWVLHLWGEYYGSKIQKQSYSISAEQKRDIVLFDAIIEQNGNNSMYRLSEDELHGLIPEKYRVFLLEDGKTKTLADWLAKEPTNVSVYGGVSEGIVVKPVYGHEQRRAESFLGVKYKTDTYLETRKIKKVKAPIEVANPESVEKLEAYITENRMMNVISHGDIEVNIKNFGAFRKEFVSDIRKEFLDDEPEALSLYTSSDIETAMTKNLGGAISNVVRKTLLEMQVLQGEQ